MKLSLLTVLILLLPPYAVWGSASCSEQLSEGNCALFGQAEGNSSCRWCMEGRLCTDFGGECNNNDQDGLENHGDEGNEEDQEKDQDTVVDDIEEDIDQEDGDDGNEDEQEESGGNSQGDGGDKCNNFQTEMDCMETEKSCFWCASQGKCRDSQCIEEDIDGPPGTQRPRFCAARRNQTMCLLENDSCIWCEDREVCRRSEEECPGKGRLNRCRALSKDTCETEDSGCLWSEGRDRCFSRRGSLPIFGTVLEDFTGTVVCPLLTTQENCTTTLMCRWCGDTCQSAREACEDGSLGERRNPCRLTESEDVCLEMDGCLWCGFTNSTRKCRRATHAVCTTIDDFDEFLDGGGDDDFLSIADSGPCFSIDAQPECDDRLECQWCEAQLRCKNNETACREPSGEVILDLVESSMGRFKIQDDGLGPTDPNTVSVVLSYIYEVTEDGTTIQESLVDLDFQTYNIKQSIDYYLGNIEARKILFESVIDGVGAVEMEVYIMISNGTISEPDWMETWDVQRGDVKFNLVLKDWTFCGQVSPCGNSNEVSAYIDLALEIRGIFDEPVGVEDDSFSYNLGGNVPLRLSSVIEKDGFMQDIPEGFPRLEISDDQGPVFVFRFPIFEDFIVYDPLIPYSNSIPILTDEPEEDPPEEEQITTAPVSSSPTVSPVQVNSWPPKEVAREGGLSLALIVGIIFFTVGFCCVGGLCGYFGFVVLRRGEKKDRRRTNLSGWDRKRVTSDDYDEEGFHDEVGHHAAGRFGNATENDHDGLLRQNDDSKRIEDDPPSSYIHVVREQFHDEPQCDDDDDDENGDDENDDENGDDDENCDDDENDDENGDDDENSEEDDENDDENGEEDDSNDDDNESGDDGIESDDDDDDDDEEKDDATQESDKK